MFSIESLIRSCREALSDPSPALRVAEILEPVVASPGELSRALESAPEQGSLADRALHRSDDLTLIHAVLPSGIVSPQHDHLMWAVIAQYEGQEDNVVYRESPDGLVEVERRSVRAGEVFVLAEDAVHRIANPLDRPARAIHVYGGDLLGTTRHFWDPKSGRKEVATPERLSEVLQRMSAAAGGESA
ncbi:MAG: cysteine dioxygenase family protein [Proteobacteria bacterium]|nr:cysteine dioxygenase family protein [Pseudomonadota bacterium]